MHPIGATYSTCAFGAVAVGREIPVRISYLRTRQRHLRPERIARTRHAEQSKLLGRRVIEDSPPRPRVMKRPRVKADRVVARLLETGHQGKAMPVRRHEIGAAVKYVDRVGH